MRTLINRYTTCARGVIYSIHISCVRNPKRLWESIVVVEGSQAVVRLEESSLSTREVTDTPTRSARSKVPVRTSRSTGKRRLDTFVYKRLSS